MYNTSKKKNENWTEWSAIKSEIIHVTWNHKYDFKPKFHPTQFDYHFMSLIHRIL